MDCFHTYAGEKCPGNCEYNKSTNNHYQIVVSEGNGCWLVMLTNPSRFNWDHIATMSSKEDAIDLANEIRNSIIASPVSVS